MHREDQDNKWDLFLNIINNPDKNFEDLINAGFTADNSELLSKDIYQDILDNNIKVAGLEELLDNLYNETQTNIKEVKEGFLVKYYN